MSTHDPQEPSFIDLLHGGTLTSSGTAPPLTRQMLDDFLEREHEAAERAREEQYQRFAAFRALRLDYDAMTENELAVVMLAEGNFVMHPRDAKLVDGLVEKYRRDR